MIKNIFLDGLVLAILFLLTMNSFTTKSLKADLNDSNEIETFEPFVMLELFTSQGCSSCPPADDLLEQVKMEYPDNVFALSYHVDYWNYIGWEDPFSKSSFTKKQGLYNIKLRNRSNYTPQIVVNGQEHFVGSNAQKMKMAVNSYLKEESKNNIELNITEKSDGQITFAYELGGDIDDKKLRALLALDKRITKVQRGENRSRTLANANVVVAEKPIEIDGSTGELTIDIPEIVKLGEKMYLVMLVENADNDILGASKIATSL